MPDAKEVSPYMAIEKNCLTGSADIHVRLGDKQTLQFDEGGVRLT